MATTSYVTLINAVINQIKNSSNTSSIPDANFIYGDEPFGAIMTFPSVTVELVSAEEDWKTMPSGKEEVCSIMIRVYDKYLKYTSGLQSIEGYVKNINDALTADITLGSNCLFSQVITKNFSTGVLNNVPIFACEMELQVKRRFTPAT